MPERLVENSKPPGQVSLPSFGDDGLPIDSAETFWNEEPRFLKFRAMSHWRPRGRLERIIWALYAGGATFDEIGEKCPTISRGRLHAIVTGLEKRWKDRLDSREDLD